MKRNGAGPGNGSADGTGGAAGGVINLAHLKADIERLRMLKAEGIEEVELRVRARPSCKAVRHWKAEIQTIRRRPGDRKRKTAPVVRLCPLRSKRQTGLSTGSSPN